jgi:hypothetical protein
MKISCKIDSQGYYISIFANNQYYISDYDTAKLLDISFEEYKNFLLENNADYFYYGIYFKTKEECNNCIDKLKKTYIDNLICLTLIGRQI